MSQINEKLMLRKLLIFSATGISSRLISFSGWLITAFGASIGLLFANLEATLKVLPSNCLKTSVSIYLSAVILHVVQRYLANFSAAGGLGDSFQNPLTEEELAKIDFNYVYQEIERTTFYPAKWLIKQQFKAAAKGDYAAGGHMHYRVAQFEGALAVLQAILCITAVAVFVFSIEV